MIRRLTGVLEEVHDGRALVRVGPISVEVLVPTADAPALEGRRGEEVVFHTLAYLEGQGQGTSFVPRLLGFTSPDARAFFELFTTVKGMGSRKALRALAVPFAEVAAAVGSKDVALLKSLPEIGPRTAETIVAELGGKVDRFIEVLPAGAGTITAGGATGAAGAAARGPVEDAIRVLVQLGEPSADARRLVERVARELPDADDPGLLIEAVYRAREAG